MAQFDLIIRNGTIIDGMRNPRFVGDIGIRNGKVASITNVGGLSLSQAKTEIDAKGLIVAPGFIDVHTHFDAQLFWDPYCTMNGWHGVTSVVIGNCGFGLAPCKPELRERAMATLTRNEAISLPAMQEGITWSWQSFPEYMDAMTKLPKGVNVISYVPLAPIFMDVMGVEEAKKRRPNAEEKERMKQLIREGMDAGACGLSVQFMGENSIQRDYDGTPMITDIMNFDDMVEFSTVLKEKGRGAFQGVGLTKDQAVKIMEASGANYIHNVIAMECDQHGLRTDGWEEWLQFTIDCNARGLRLTPQTFVIGVDYELTFEDWNLFDTDPVWRDVCMGSIAEKIEKMKDPKRREHLRQVMDNFDRELAARFDSATTTAVPYVNIDHFSVVLCENEDLQKYEGMLIGQIAEQENKHPIDVMLDIAIADELRTTFASPPMQLNPEGMKKILNTPYTMPGISDGGAHMKFGKGGRFTTEYIVEWVRKHKLVDLEHAHWQLSQQPAMYAGLHDRGVIALDRPADIIIYDFDKLDYTPLEKVYDLPAGDWRRISKGVGYRYTIVNGEITFIDGECTNKTPGQLLRFGQG